MPKDPIEIKTKKDKEERRAKHARVDMNAKRIDLPLKAAHSSSENIHEIAIAKKEVDRTVLNEIGIIISPKRLRKIVGDPYAHQREKDSIAKLIKTVGKNCVNTIYPLLLNQRSPRESEKDFRPFPAPTERIAQKLFDMFDIEGIDIIIAPQALDDINELDWSKVCSKVFANRKPDYLNEYVLSGLIPNSISTGSAQKMAQIYLENGFESLSFDFAGRRVLESKMRHIIDSIPDWDELLIYGTRVPHFNWHGTHDIEVLPTYDMLVSVYGFDSFSNVFQGFGVDLSPERIRKKIKRKRYRMIETYGTYNKYGLAEILEHYDSSCKCPTCRRTKSPIELYERPVTERGLQDLHNDLKIHRYHNTHKETEQYSSLIDKGKYHDYVIKKRAATKELQEIISAITDRNNKRGLFRY